MPTFHTDFNLGNDTADGTSWASAWKTFAGSTAAKIAPGDFIKFSKSPDPTLLGNAQWTTAPMPAAKVVVSSLALTPIRVVVTSHGYSTGDCVYIYSHATNTSANGNWLIDVLDASAFTLRGSVGVANGTGGGAIMSNAGCVILDNPVNSTICSCDSSTWTPFDAAKVTPTRNLTDWKEGYSSAQFAMGATLGTEGAAWVETDNTALNLAAYTQISFWAKSSVALNNGDLTLSLCSDKTGTVPVNTISIPPQGANAYWSCHSVDTSSALGSSIQSVILSQAVDKGAFTFYLDNIIACTSPASNDSLNLTSLISKNGDASGGGTEGYFAIKSIKDRIVVLDHVTSSTASVNYGYWGDTSYCPTYKRECFRVPVGAGSGSLTNGQTNEAGTNIAQNTMSGGWNPSTNQQDGATFFDGGNCWGYGIYIAHAYWTFDRFNTVRFLYGLVPNANENIITNCNTSNHNISRNIAISAACAGSVYTVANASYSGDIGISSTAGSYGFVLNCENCWAHQVGTKYGIYLTGSTGCTLNLGKIYGNQYGIYIANGSSINTINNMITRYNVSGGVADYPTAYVNFYNCKQYDTWTIGPAGWNSQIFSEMHDGTFGNNKVICENGNIISQTTTSLTGRAWDFNITGARVDSYPLILKLFRTTVSSGVKLDTTVSMMKSHATNVGGGLYIRGNQVGLHSDSSANMIDTTNWQSVVLPFTPTMNGTIEVEARAWYTAGTGDVYIDSQMSVL